MDASSYECNRWMLHHMNVIHMISYSKIICLNNLKGAAAFRYALLQRCNSVSNVYVTANVKNWVICIFSGYYA